MLLSQFRYGIIQKSELTENSNFRLFAANGNGKWKFVSLVGNDLTIIDDCCFSKHAHLWSSWIRNYPSDIMGKQNKWKPCFGQYIYVNTVYKN